MEEQREAFLTGMGPGDRKGGLQDQDHMPYLCHLSSFPAVTKQLCSQWQVTKALATLAQGQSRGERNPMGNSSSGKILDKSCSLWASCPCMS